jgi:hypothetical protein
MPTPSAEFLVNGNTVSGAAVAVSASSTVQLALASVFGVNTVAWTVIGTSDDALAKPTITPSGSPSGVTASFTVPSGANQGYLVQAQIENQGKNTLGQQVAAYTFRALIGVIGSSGDVPFVFGERLERNETHGTVPKLNDIAESAAGGGGGGSSDVSIDVGANHTITDDDYGGLDPATARLIVYVSAAAEITFPTTPVHGQVVEVVSLGGTSYSVTIVPGGGNQMAQYTNQQTTSSSFVINSSTLRFSVSWRCLDNGTNKRWVALTAPKRTGHTFADGLVVAAANAVVCNPSTSTNTTGTELAISEGHVLRRLAGGNLSSGKVTGPLCDFSGLSTYADDTAAGVGGLTAGQLYKTATGVVMVKL